MAEHVERDRLDVISDVGLLPDVCDAILANDAISAALLAERYPGTRLVQFAHSNLFDHQLPVLLPGVVSAVLVGSDLMTERIRALALDAPIIRVRQPIDTERFVPRGAPRERPRRALVLSNYLRGERLEALASAWEPQGVELVRIGTQAEVELDVVPWIADADIVVAKARAALEGMSCGRPVYVFDEFGGDGWVTGDNYALLEANNFAGTAYPTALDRDRLAADLAGYRPAMGAVNRDLVRTHHRARQHAWELVEILRGPGPRPAEAPAQAGEVARLQRAAWHAERRALALERQLDDLQARVLRAEEAAHAGRGPAGRARGGPRHPPRAGGTRGRRAPGQGAQAMSETLVPSSRFPGLLVDPSVELPRRRAHRPVGDDPRAACGSAPA